MECGGGVDRALLNVICSTAATLLVLLQLFAPLSTAAAGAGKTLTERDVLPTRTGMLRVSIGRFVDVKPGIDLNITVLPGDRCTVRVLHDVDALSQLPGRLIPSVFPCHFGAGSVRYQHYGSRHPSDDSVRLQLRYDSDTQTLIVPFTLNVDVDFTQLEIVTKNMPLVVKKLRGSSRPFSERTTQFTYDDATQFCRVTVLSGAGGVPRYGVVVDANGVRPTDRDCNEFISAKVRYRHTASTDSPRRDYIPMLAQLFDRQSGRLVKQEYLQAMVRIKAGRTNRRPILTHDALLRLEVNQFVLTAVTRLVLAAEDHETPAERLVFNITQSPALGEGCFVSTDDRSQPIRSFTQRDMQDLKIAYDPPSDDSDIRRVFQFRMQIIDDEGATSDQFSFTVIVKPMNTLAPSVSRNTGIQLFEGQSRQLLSSQNLQVSDEDNIGNVRLSVVAGLRHGSLTVGGVPEWNYFIPADLDIGNVVYTHDGSDTYSDNIVLRMTDGVHNVEFLFPVTVYPEDDEPPILAVNTGLETYKSGAVRLTPDILSATDIDSDNAEILFTLEQPYSKNGYIVFRQMEVPADPDKWRHVNGYYERVVSQWGQRDMEAGHMFYIESGTTHTTDVKLDRILFRIRDTHSPPNMSPIQQLVVTVLPVDDQAPIVVTDTPYHLSVNEYELTPFSRHVMQYSDVDSNSRDLKYIVTQPPYMSDPTGSSDGGNIVLCEDDDVEVEIFTQTQVNFNKICYQPPGSEIGIAPHVVKFDYRVVDPAGNSIDGQSFVIYLNPVDNKPPNVVNSGVRVTENDRVVITSDMLDAIDPDTDIDQIEFSIIQVPQYGSLQVAGVNVQVGDTFNKRDISLGHVVYMNTGDEKEEDSFSVDVTDGRHVVPVTVKVTVDMVDDEMPTFVLPGLLGVTVTVEEGQSTILTVDHLKALDHDTDDDRLTFTVATQPKEGAILLSGQRTESFTQKDILDGFVSYRHLVPEIGMRVRIDSFNLSLSDGSEKWVVGGNRITNVNVQVKITPVDNQKPQISVYGEFAVPEGGKTTLETEYLTVVDADSDEGAIVCTIVKPPSHGYLENMAPAPGSEHSRVGIPISAFSNAHLKKASINYVQSIHEGIEPRNDRFTIECSDGINVSPKRVFPVIITPANDETPEIYVREFVVQEGSNLVIDMPILNVVDKDIPADEILFSLLSLPNNGKLVRHEARGSFDVKNFTMLEVRRGNIVYEHDNSETIKDTFKVNVTDGKHSIEKEIAITILPVDDETPRLTVNNGLDVEVDEIVVITNDDLRATDLDSNDDNITYILQKVPAYGFLQRVAPTLMNLTRGMNFSQWEIDVGHMQYRHTGRDGVRDLIKFDLTDGHNPFIDRYFYVNIEGVDKVYPEVLSKGVELPEGGSIILTTDLLSTTDSNSPDENLEFTITRAPSKGYLELTDNPGVAITTFTQLQLAGNKVRYVHSSDDEIKLDSFVFEVTDGFNPVYRTFRISLADIDNKKPILMFETLRLQEGNYKQITPFELKAVDRDTSDRLVKFTVVSSPRHGRILYNRSRSIASFTMHDLSENMISYKHDGSETTTDSFSVRVRDRTHRDFYVFPDTSTTTRQAQVIPIEIIPVDNFIPRLKRNKLATSLSLYEGIGLGFLFTRQYLTAEDRDSPNDKLVYVITQPPKLGYFINSAGGNRSINSWTQGDIDDRRVFYVKKYGTNATTDSFQFKILDKAGNILEDQEFVLHWSWVRLDKHVYVVKETKKMLEILLYRHGYLRETSFVTIEIEDDTATTGFDFSSRFADQVQFNPGETEKVWRLRLIDDSLYENEESFSVTLTDAVMTSIEHPQTAVVSITDDEDESQVSFPKSRYEIAESIGKVLVPVRRSGDVSEEFLVVCSTLEATARGTTSNAVTSFSDYVSRPENHRSIIVFAPNVTEKFCFVTVIDDSLYEEEEEFKVVLSMAIGGRLGPVKQTVIAIKPDEKDVPVFYFDVDSYNVDESDGFVNVKIWRTGTDNSQKASVTVRSRKTTPVSAQSGIDYVPVNQVVHFAPGVLEQTLRVTIIDDLGQPKMEGNEKFELVLRMPTGGTLGQPSKSLVTINDSFSDLPIMQFKSTEYTGFENDGKVVTYITRHGDINHVSSVRCYTRQASARVVTDYVERPDTDVSRITFEPGETEVRCEVALKSDSLHEGDEEFRLVLGDPQSPTALSARIGSPDHAVITVIDLGDKSIIKFAEKRYSVSEPEFSGETRILSLPVLRGGDTSKVSIVRVHTRDGIAKAGKDYVGFSKELTFGVNVTRLVVNVKILHDVEVEMREAFTVHLRPDRNLAAEIETKKVIVYIEQTEKFVDVTFPTRPVVVSLQDYDDTDRASPQPTPGYPVICVTACDPRHPEYSDTRQLCGDEGINHTLTRYRWRVAAPSGVGGNALRDVQPSAFFASTHLITLDSVYFRAGSRIECVARAVNSDSQPGLEVASSAVTVSSEEGICLPQVSGALGAEPFSAKMKYTGPGDPAHPNMVRLSVLVPHRDGLLPAISTQVLSNFDLALSPDAFRVGLHKCSNLIDVGERETRESFLTPDLRDHRRTTEALPFQFNEQLRSEPTLRFYRSLDIESCMWEFVSYYTVSELVSQCGGEIGTDGQVLNLTQSYVSLRVPLYVSYVFHSAAARAGWQNYNLQTQLQLTFVYDTAILWQDGISTPEGSQLQGLLHPTSMRMLQDGRLQVQFRTEALFRGQFVPSYSGASFKATVTSKSHPTLTFTLQHLRSEPTFSQPEQTWQFTSDYAVRDYSGNYIVKLIPCTTPMEQRFSRPVTCNPHPAVPFDLQIRFQQVSDPVPAEFSLNTQFHLMQKKSLWLSDGTAGFGEGIDASFTADDWIYGRIMTDPVQSLGESFNLGLEKLFLCTGKDGYIPKYDPANHEYGCVAESPNLLHTLRLLDRGAPETEVKSFRGLNFKAIMAADDPEAKALIAQPGSDGFRISAKPLFQVDAGRQWFLHAIYNIRSPQARNRRSVEYNILAASPPGVSVESSKLRRKRALEDMGDIGVASGTGTNLVRIVTALPKTDVANVDHATGGVTQFERSESDSNVPQLSMVIVVSVLLLFLFLLLLLLLCRRRRQQKKELESYGNATAVSVANGNVAVVNTKYIGKDASEV